MNAYPVTVAERSLVPPLTPVNGAADPHRTQSTHPLTGAEAAYTWPAWARTARIAGAYFSPDDSADEIDAQLAALAEQNVSVIITDSPLGELYSAWVDDAQFAAVKSTIATVVQLAHARGLRIVLYHTGLELIAPPDRNPGLENPHWAQLSIDGHPVLFNDVDNSTTHWLEKGLWDFWVTPCSQDDDPTSFRSLSLARVAELVETGIDGLWVDQAYLQGSVGDHDDMWPSRDSCSVAAFEAQTGVTFPEREDWDDPAFQRWVIWRHSQITDFLVAEKNLARSINPHIVFLNENSSVDTGRATYVATDAADLLPYSDMTTGHEIETIADRMDAGETGMQNANLDQWLAFRTMVAFARAADHGKPSWVLTYGYAPRDAAQLAGLVLAEQANFYETRGPQMADTVGESFRRRLFGWVAEHAEQLYSGNSIARVALLYSPRNRDLLDTVAGEPYEMGESLHFARYRAVANLLYRAHIPFDIVVDTEVQRLDDFANIILPELQFMSETTAAALRAHPGKIIAIGPTGLYDEWGTLREQPALTDHPVTYLSSVDADLAALVNTDQLVTNAPPTLQISIHRRHEGHKLAYSVVLVNTAPLPTAMPVRLTLSTDALPGSYFNATFHPFNGDNLTAAHLQTMPLSTVFWQSSQNRATNHLNTLNPGPPATGLDQALHVVIPAGISTFALLDLVEVPNPYRIHLPTVEDGGAARQ